MKKKSNISAALLAFFLGIFGAHKFYMGYTKQGWIMVAAYVVGLFTAVFGVGLILMLGVGITALIEAIIYCTMSKKKFNKTYIKAHKAWF